MYSRNQKYNSECAFNQSTWKQLQQGTYFLDDKINETTKVSHWTYNTL